MRELVETLARRDADAVEGAFEALVARGPAITDALVDLLAHHGNDARHLRRNRALLRVLGRLGEPGRTVPVLLEHAHGRGELSAAAEWGLRELGAASVPALVRGLSAPSPRAVHVVLRLLRDFSATSKATAIFARWLAAEPDDTDRAYFVRMACEEIAALGACDAPMRERIRHHARAPDAAVALAALEALAALGEELRVVETLERRATDSAPFIPGFAQLLGRLRDPDACQRARPLLWRYVADEPQGATSHVVDALQALERGQPRAPDDGDRLRDIASDPHHWGYMAAVAALYTRDAPGLPALVRPALPALGAWDRVAVMPVFGPVDSDEARAALAALAAQLPHDEVQYAVGAGLAGNFPPEVLVPFLRRELPHETTCELLAALSAVREPAQTTREAVNGIWRASLRRLREAHDKAQRKAARLVLADATLARLALEPAPPAGELVTALVEHAARVAEGIEGYVSQHVHGGVLVLELAHQRDWLERAAHVIEPHLEALPREHRRTLAGHFAACDHQLERLTRLLPRTRRNALTPLRHATQHAQAALILPDLGDSLAPTTREAARTGDAEAIEAVLRQAHRRGLLGRA